MVKPDQMVHPLHPLDIQSPKLKSLDSIGLSVTNNYD